MSTPEPPSECKTLSPCEQVLPPELERAIFLLTARTYPSVCINLMLVASYVKSWIEPVVYNTVALCGTSNAIRFRGALDCRSPEFAKTQVKALSICPTVSFPAKLDLLTACSGVESLALCIHPPLFEKTFKLVDLLSSLPLTSLFITLPSTAQNNASNFSLQIHSVFVNLTHLYLADHWAVWLPSLGIEHLPLLTHLAFRLRLRKHVSETHSTILSQSPKLRVFIFFVDKTILPGTKERLEEQDLRDGRVVVIHHMRDVEKWERIHPGVECMWERAERIVKWRLDNQAGPYGFPPGFAFGCTKRCCSI